METFTGADIATTAAASTDSAVSTPTPETTAAVSTPTTTDSASASATTTPVIEESDDLTDNQIVGPMPPERVRRVLANREKKVSERLQKEWQEKYGFAETADPQELKAALDWHRRGNADPVGFVTNLWEQVQSNPQLGPQLRSQAARILGQRQQPAADERPQPDVPTIDAEGRAGRMVYSDEQLMKLLDWNNRQADQRTTQKYAPLLEAHERTQQERADQAEQSRADSFAARTIETAGKLPGFADHAKTILERYAALPTVQVRDQRTGKMLTVPDPDDPRTEDRKLLDIYHDVVLPTFQQSATQTAVHTLQSKARATTLNPAGASAAEPFDHKKASWAESFAHLAKQRGFSK